MAMIQLVHQLQKYWWRDESVKMWLVSHGKILYVLSIFTGSPYTAVSLMNSALFQLDIFTMNLSREQLIRYQVKRVYSTVLFEV